jgi:hypothetical protein
MAVFLVTYLADKEIACFYVTLYVGISTLPW